MHQKRNQKVMMVKLNIDYKPNIHPAGNEKMEDYVRFV